MFNISDALYVLVLWKTKEFLANVWNSEAVSAERRIAQFITQFEFQAAEPATAEARRPYVLRPSRFACIMYRIRFCC